MEEWLPIPEFLRYSISTLGRVRNDDSGRIMALMKNQHDNVYVGLMNPNAVQQKRSVALLVAQAFVPRHRNEKFDTPIHLDGDLTNNDADNLQWRPRWFAVLYHLQFKKQRFGFTTPIRDIATGEIYQGSMEAAVANGLLETDVVVSVNDKTYCPPTYQRFEIV